MTTAKRARFAERMQTTKNLLVIGQLSYLGNEMCLTPPPKK